MGERFGVILRQVVWLCGSPKLDPISKFFFGIYRAIFGLYGYYIGFQWNPNMDHTHKDRKFLSISYNVTVPRVIYRGYIDPNMRKSKV